MSDTVERGDELMRIERFAGEDPEAASEAFALLAPKIRAVVVRLLANSVPRSVDREEVAETVLQRLWQKRKEFEPRSIPAWWRYVAVTARRCAADQWRPETPAEIAEDAISGPDEPQTIDASRLYEAADELWLRVESTLNRRHVPRGAFGGGGKSAVAFERLVEHRIEETGVGLASIQRIVEKHGDRFSVESKSGEGSTFLCAGGAFSLSHFQYERP